MCRPRPATPKFPELTPQLGGILKAYYAELAAGTGRWSIKAASTPMPVGPADAAIWSTCAAAGDYLRSGWRQQQGAELVHDDGGFVPVQAADRIGLVACPRPSRALLLAPACAFGSQQWPDLCRLITARR